MAILSIEKLPELTARQLVVLPVIGALLYLVGIVGYNLFLHPLRKAPGPFLNRISNIPCSRSMLSGHDHDRVRKLHQKYGSVVRLAPNQVSFDTATSLKDIYGHATSGRRPFLKADFYSATGEPATFDTARNPAEHARLRKLVSNSFSSRSLTEQEPFVHKYVDLFIEKLCDTDRGGEDIVRWFTFCTFDIVGDLIFSDPFGALEAREEHFWMRVIDIALEAPHYMASLQKYPFGQYMKEWLLPSKFKSARIKHLQYSREKVMRRMNNPTDRKDFLTKILTKILTEKEVREAPIGALQSHSSTLVIGGSETTTTVLSAISYHLMKNAATQKRLVNEIRSSFESYESICGSSCEQLPYLKAVIDEGLRIFPAIPTGLPRVSPGATVDGIYIPAGVEVATHTWSVQRNPGCWTKPEEFIPERWLDKEYEGEDKSASQPFSLGPRACIGRNLALLELQVILAKLLYVYDLEMVGDGKDFERESKSFLFWRKSKILTRFNRRQGVIAP